MKRACVSGWSVGAAAKPPTRCCRCVRGLLCRRRMWKGWWQSSGSTRRRSQSGEASSWMRRSSRCGAVGSGVSQGQVPVPCVGACLRPRRHVFELGGPAGWGESERKTDSNVASMNPPPVVARVNATARPAPGKLRAPCAFRCVRPSAFFDVFGECLESVVVECDQSYLPREAVQRRLLRERGRSNFDNGRESYFSVQSNARTPAKGVAEVQIPGNLSCHRCCVCEGSGPVTAGASPKARSTQARLTWTVRPER